MARRGRTSRILDMLKTMISSALKPAWSWLFAAGLLALLLFLASLQYRWLEEVSRVDRDKSRGLLQAAVARFAEDFDRELTRVFLYLQPHAATFASRRQHDRRSAEQESFADKYRRWQAYAPFPDLVRDVWMARLGDDGTFETSRFDPAEEDFAPAVWPAELEPLLLPAAEWRPRHRHESHEGPARLRILADEVPALMLPVFGGGPPGASGYLMVRLDLDTIRDVILPRLSEQYLNAGGTQYQAEVFAPLDQRTIFRRGAPQKPADRRGGDAGADLFSLLPPEKLGALELEADPESGGRFRGRRFAVGSPYLRFYHFVAAQEHARWRLEASHPAGSLDTAVARAHRRNLAISFGILLLLGASLMLMLVSTRRLQALARQQLEFVAGVSHELLTPLAAMRSAGQNLADGVAAEPQQVRRYGRLIDDQGRRLSTMVEQVLEFAGMQAGGRSYRLARTGLAPLVEAALAEVRPLLEERDVQLEKHLADDLPDVMADAAALRRALLNLITNAVKYGVPGSARGGPAASWIGLRALAAGGPKGPEVRISVEDRGPGIAAADLPRLFEPFYRGRTPAATSIAGSGLGLSLVRHIALGHGGRVTVASREGAGSTFTLHLPAVADDRPGAGSPGGTDER